MDSSDIANIEDLYKSISDNDKDEFNILRDKFNTAYQKRMKIDEELIEYSNKMQEIIDRYNNLAENTMQSYIDEKDYIQQKNYNVNDTCERVRNNRDFYIEILEKLLL